MPVTVADAGAEFAEHLAGQGLAAGTIERQIGAISGRHGFLAACQKKKGRNVTMGQIDQGCVTAYFAAHVGTNGSRNNKLASLRKFLQWAEKRKMLRFTAADLLDGQKRMKAIRKPKLYLEAERFEKFLASAEKTHRRDRATVALVLYTLCRQSEVKVLQLKHLDLDALELKVWREKTDHWTVTGISLDLAEEMTYWLDWYAEHTGYQSWRQMAEEHPDWYLVPRGTHGREWRKLRPDMPFDHVEMIFHRALLKMGFSAEEIRGEGAHTGRRSGARAMFLYLRTQLGHDGALTEVQTMCDHEKPEQTQDYIDMGKQKEALNTWLKTNRMYGQTTKFPSNVVEFRQRRGA